MTTHVPEPPAAPAEPPKAEDQLYTRDQVTTALNRGADLIAVEYQIQDSGLLSLLVNAAGYLLDHPAATIAEVIAESYGEPPEI